MDWHNNGVGASVVEELSYKECGLSVGWPRGWGRRRYCTYYNNVLPSNTQIFDKLLEKVRHARWLGTSFDPDKFSEKDRTKFVFFKDSCFSGQCSGHGSCNNHRCVCSGTWTGTACGYDRRRRRAPSRRRRGCLPGDAVCHTPHGPVKV